MCTHQTNIRQNGEIMDFDAETEVLAKTQVSAKTEASVLVINTVIPLLTAALFK